MQRDDAAFAGSVGDTSEVYGAQLSGPGAALPVHRCPEARRRNLLCGHLDPAIRYAWPRIRARAPGPRRAFVSTCAALQFCSLRKLWNFGRGGEWSGWALPMDGSQLHHVTLHMRHILGLSRTFLQRQGQVRLAPVLGNLPLCSRQSPWKSPPVLVGRSKRKGRRGRQEAWLWFQQLWAMLLFFESGCPKSNGTVAASLRRARSTSLSPIHEARARELFLPSS